MERAEAEVISPPFFQLHKAANHIEYVQASKYLLYGVLGDQVPLIRDCEYKSSFSFPGTVKITRRGEDFVVKEIIFMLEINLL